MISKKNYVFIFILEVIFCNMFLFFLLFYIRDYQYNALHIDSEFRPVMLPLLKNIITLIIGLLNIIFFGGIVEYFIENKIKKGPNSSDNIKCFIEQRGLFGWR